MPFAIALTETPDPDDLALIGEGLTAFNAGDVGPSERRALAIFVRDEAGAVKGGLSGYTAWGWLYIQWLWFDADCRGQGLAPKLLAMAEDEAVARGCHGAYIDTFSCSMKSDTLGAPQALLIAGLGMGALSAMDAVAKALGADFPVMQVVMMRYLGAALWLALFIAATRRAWPQRRYLGRHLIRSALMCLTAFLFFYAITHLPLAVATALIMPSPVYVALLGIVFLKEPARKSIGLAIVIGLAGALVIIGWGGETVSATGEASPWAWAAALLAPITYAAGIVLLKHHSGEENAAAITLAQSVLITLIALPFALPVFVMPESGQWASVGLVGFLGALGYLLFIAALRHLPASIFALVDYTSLLWAAALGYLVFAEVPGLSLWLGGILIIAACFIGMQAARGLPVGKVDTPKAQNP